MAEHPPAQTVRTCHDCRMTWSVTDEEWRDHLVSDGHAYWKKYMDVVYAARTRAKNESIEVDSDDSGAPQACRVLP